MNFAYNFDEQVAKLDNELKEDFKRYDTDEKANHQLELKQLKEMIELSN